MSCFVTSNEHITHVVSLLANFDKWCGTKKDYMVASNGVHIPVDDTPARRTRLGRKLLNLNKLAMQERYGDRHEESYKGQRYEWDRAHMIRLPVVTRVGQLKLLHSLIYQCSEGRAMKTPLYKQLEKIAAEIDAWFMRDPSAPSDAPVGDIRDHFLWEESPWSI